MLLIRLFIFSVLYFNNINDIPKDRTIFISPLKIPQLLSANFGELRIDHFHSGLDIKTQGVTGKEVVAAADGYIYRISITAGGFGNALYIRHPSGYSTVYGHLEKFVPEIDKYVKDQQYERRTFPITLFPLKEQFPVKQGQIIAYSGNSGASGGPHLHFEIRKSDSEKPVNPLLFKFNMEDNINPVIEKLFIYPVNHHSFINNRNSIKKINVTGSHGVYSVPQETRINVSGLTGFGIKAYDMLNDSPNRCAVYSIELIIDSSTVFKYVMDGFSFDESRYVNSHIDYETLMRDNIYIERTFVLPDDKLSVYKDVVNRGLYDFNDGKLHKAKILVYDANGNRSVLSFQIKSQPEQLQEVTDSTDKNIIAMPYNRTNRFSSEKISVTIPEGALYDTLLFSYKTAKGTSGMLSDLHYIANIYTPLQKPFSISIKPDIIPSGKESKMLIVHSGDDQKPSGVSSRWNGEYLTADVLSFGKYYVGIDTIPPVISANGLIQGANLSGRKDIRIKITDELSGIKSYEGTIDGNWALFEYDQKNDMLVYRFDESRISKRSEHNLLLKVSDNKDNIRIYKCNFTW
jgi:hypothetical protein